MGLGAFRGSRKEFDRLPGERRSEQDGFLYGMNTPHGPVIPNLGDWLAGDVILSRRNGVGSRAIAAYQGGLGLGDASKWSHVAIYAGSGRLWDATPKLHIQQRTTGELVRAVEEFGVYRYRGATIGAEELERHVREQSIASYNVGRYLGILSARVLRIAGYLPTGRVPANSVICSVFVERVLFLTLGEQVLPGVPIAVPADFAVSSRFEEIAANWCRCTA